YNGAVLRRKLSSGIAMKAFAEKDFLGQRWNFNTGFKGTAGLGLSSFDSGVYTVSGWGGGHLGDER
ncbi:hypothetical protein OAG28_02530, partial [Akkermansiaceae bacterium]|nr:hypothetical protein [Akkermansiaceae bacterium]